MKLIGFFIIMIGLVACQAVDSAETAVPSEPQALPGPAGRPTLQATGESPVAIPVSPVVTPPATAAANRETPMAAPTLPPGSEAPVAQAREMLLQLLQMELAADEIRLVTVESKQWRDSSLGCPREGMKYNQVITPGYLIILEAAGKQFEFHTNTREAVVLCFINGKDALDVLQP
jgi:hypothetical protein